MLRIAGGLFWLLVGVPRLLAPDPLWLLPWLCFGAGYFWVTFPRPVPSRPPLSLVLAAAVQAAAALALLRYSGTGLHAVLLTILAGTLPAIFPSRVTFAWVGAQTLGLWWALTAHGTPQLEVRGYVFGHLTFQLFALGV